MAAKKCTKCGEQKAVSDFCGHKTTKDKLQPWCKPCFVIYRKEYREKNPERVKAGARRWIVENRERVNAKARERRARNPEKLRALYLRRADKQSAWVSDNRDRVRAAAKRWRSRNQHIRRMDSRLRKTARKMAQPPWMKRCELEPIYRQAVASGLVVDHIVPLRSKIVCGLHVPWNLQLLTPIENSKKSNKIWPDMP
jgi:hypothetical protein